MEHPTRGLRMLHQVSVMSGTEGMIEDRLLTSSPKAKRFQKRS